MKLAIWKAKTEACPTTLSLKRRLICWFRSRKRTTPNGERRIWYVPAGLAVASFEKWLPPKLKPNGQYDDRAAVRSDRFMIAEVMDYRCCWKCKEASYACR
jgi:hypothetical protein